MFKRIDHIGVAVEDLDAAIKLYERGFEMELVHRETVESQGVEAVLLDVGEGHVELLAPLGPDTPVGKFIAKKGPGIHHVAYSVDDIDATLEQAKAAGMRMIDDAMRQIEAENPSLKGALLAAYAEVGQLPVDELLARRQARLQSYGRFDIEYDVGKPEEVAGA